MTGKHGRDPGNGFPVWVNITVIFSLLGLLGWNVIIVGPAAYPTSVMLGTLLGGYLALDRNLKRKNSDPPDPPDEGGA